MRYVHRATLEYVVESDEGRFLLPAGEAGLVELSPDQVVPVCDLCEEPEDDPANDPLGHFKGEVFGSQVVAHGQCGLDHELELA